jgi:histidine ammonia-lyase
MTTPITLDPGHVTLAQLRRIHAGGVQLTLDPSAQAGMQAALTTVQRIVEEDQVVYGINTGFGKLASTKIAHERLAELQKQPGALAQRGHRARRWPPPWCVWCWLTQGREPGARACRASVWRSIEALLLALPMAHDVLPVIPAQGLGRRLGRPRPAGPSGRRADRRRRGLRSGGRPDVGPCEALAARRA